MSEIQPPLTDDEHEALRLSAALANLVRKIVGSGPQADNDWDEAAQRIHAIQHTIMAQAAARAYPDQYRLLGGSVAPGSRPSMPNASMTTTSDPYRREPVSGRPRGSTDG